MSKSKMNLQQFADRHGLQVIYGSVQGPHGELFKNQAGEFCFRRDFDPTTQAKMAIEAIGLQFTAPAEPINKDRRAFLIVKKPDGWYVTDKAGPFKTRDAALTARESLKNNQWETPKNIT